MRSVTAVVVTWDSATDIDRCLQSLDAVEHDAFEVVVLDNASEDDTVMRIEAFQRGARRHPITLVRFEENRGFCGAVNAGIRLSDADAVLLINPDATLESGAVARMLEVLSTHPRCGSVQPKVLRQRWDVPAEHRATPIIDTTGHVLTRPRLLLNRGAGQPDDARFAVPGEVFGASGALVLHRRAMLEDIARDVEGTREYLTEDLVAYFDDVDLDLRARQRGWSARYEPTAVGHHARTGASERRRRRVRILNLSNLPLVVIGNEGLAHLARDAHVIMPIWLLRILAGSIRSPIAMLLAARRLALLPTAIRRGRHDRARATVPLDEVLDHWLEPLPNGWLGAAARRGLR
jgi:GT2 family glycosyltransferase